MIVKSYVVALLVFVCNSDIIHTYLFYEKYIREFYHILSKV